MRDKSDTELLRDYANRKNEAAFSEIVARHTGLVYSSALRQVVSHHLARDLTQNVFRDLARKAKPLSARLNPNASLVGWLYRSTRFAALNHLRDDHRRVTHEREAMEQILFNSQSAPDWDRISPVLDEGMGTLREQDREALLLRYFKNHDLRAVGVALGISEDAAQKRVSRAVERLREFLIKHGVTIGAGGLVALIGGNAVQAAPTGLATAISTAALAGASLSGTATAAATKVIVMTTLQKTLAGAVLAAIAGIGFYQAHQTSKIREQNRSLKNQQAPLVERIQNLQRERDEATNQLASRAADLAQNRTGDSPELLRLRAEVTRLRGQLRDLQDSQAKQNNTAAAEKLPRESWSSAGNSTPEASLQTFLSATRDHDTNSLRSVLPPDLNKQEEKRPGMTELMVTALGLKYRAVTDFQILSKTQVSPDDVLLSVRYGKVEGSATNSEVESFRMKQLQDGWKIVEQMGD